MKREKAYVDGRRQKILELLQHNPQIRVDDLAERLNVSVVTIRRDLRFLEEEINSRTKQFLKKGRP